MREGDQAGNPMDDLTQLIQAAAAGSTTAEQTLFDEVYANLKQIAARQLTRTRGHADGTLGPTALVGELYLKLANANFIQPENRGHFYAIAASAMRQIIVDDFRARATAKRAADVTPLLEDQVGDQQTPADRLLEIDDALRSLAAEDPRAAHVFECKYFAGYSTQQTAEALGLSVRSCERFWRDGRSYVRERL